MRHEFASSTRDLDLCERARIARWLVGAKAGLEALYGVPPFDLAAGNRLAVCLEVHPRHARRLGLSSLGYGLDTLSL